jgi:hypothetical protein
MENVLRQTEATRNSANRIIGQRFGKLTVLKYAGIYKNKNSVVCKCDCGNMRIAHINELTRGNLKSCGLCGKNARKVDDMAFMLAEDVMKENTEDVQSVVETNITTDVKMTPVPPKIQDMIGKKFGRLTVMKYLGVKKTQYLVECKCDCGNTTIKNAYSMRAGKTKSCGCLAKEMAQMAKSISHEENKTTFDFHKILHERNQEEMEKAMFGEEENPIEEIPVENKINEGIVEPIVEVKEQKVENKELDAITKQLTEQGILLNALTLLRNQQIRDGRPTDPVNDLIEKILYSGPRQVMVAEKGAAYEYSR